MTDEYQLIGDQYIYGDLHTCSELLFFGDVYRLAQNSNLAPYKNSSIFEMFELIHESPYNSNKYRLTYGLVFFLHVSSLDNKNKIFSYALIHLNEKKMALWKKVYNKELENDFKFYMKLFS